MQLLNKVIAVMNKEEVRNFKLWLNSTNASSARKDILLFDYIRKSADKYDEDSVFKKLYPDDDKNSFYRQSLSKFSSCLIGSRVFEQ